MNACLSLHSSVGTDNNYTKATRPPRQNAPHPSFTDLETLHFHALPTLRVDKGNGNRIYPCNLQPEKKNIHHP